MYRYSKIQVAHAHPGACSRYSLQFFSQLLPIAAGGAAQAPNPQVDDLAAVPHLLTQVTYTISRGQSRSTYLLFKYTQRHSHVSCWHRAGLGCHMALHCTCAISGCCFSTSVLQGSLSYGSIELA